MRFCDQHKIHLISDEIYALSVYNPDANHTAFCSVLSINPSGIIDPNLVHVLYGMSKVKTVLLQGFTNQRLTDCDIDVGFCCGRIEAWMLDHTKQSTNNGCAVFVVSLLLRLVSLLSLIRSDDFIVLHR